MTIVTTMFDINIYNLSDLPNKVTYCNWRIGMVFNGTENDKLSHNHNIVILFPIAPWATIEMHSNSPPKFPITMGDR